MAAIGSPSAGPVLLSEPAPLYHQLYQALRERIVRGELRPGDRLPTIRELCQHYQVSRSTVTQALGALAQERLVGRHQGKGIFVAEPRFEQGPVRLVSFTEEMVLRGHVPATRILKLARITASAEIAERLQLTVGEALVHVERLRFVDGQPLALMTSFLPECFFPGLADSTEPIGSLYQLFQERYGIIPTVATDTYTAIRLTTAQADLLQARPGAPALSVARVTRDQRNRLVEFAQSVLRGDRYQVVLELRRGGS